MSSKRRKNKHIVSGINILNPVINKRSEFSIKKSLYKEINKYGYKLFELSSLTMNLIKNYGVENIFINLQKANVKIAEVVKDVDFNKLEGSNVIYDKTRKSAVFFRIDDLKKIDVELYNIVISANNDLKEISDLCKWFHSKPTSDVWKECLFITLSFLMSTPCNGKIKNENGIQGLHSDYPFISRYKEDESENEYFESNYPLSVLIALQDNSFFRFLCNSHNQYDRNGKPNATSYNCKVLKLKPGQFIIFHPNLIHSGNHYIYIYIYNLL